MADLPRIELLNLISKTVLLEDGQVLAVTHIFDAVGDETDDLNVASVCVAGPLADGAWMRIDVGRLERVSLQ